VLTLADRFDGRQDTFRKRLQEDGYQTAIFGKWHLGHGDNADPTGFDRWAVLPAQCLYHDPDFFVMGERTGFSGYATDLITDFSFDSLRDRDRGRPFMVMIHHKGPHRPWHPDKARAHLYDDVDIPLPETFSDDYSNRSNAARNTTMRIKRDLTLEDLKEAVPVVGGPAAVESIVPEPSIFVYVPLLLKSMSLPSPEVAGRSLDSSNRWRDLASSVPRSCIRKTLCHKVTVVSRVAIQTVEFFPVEWSEQSRGNQPLDQPAHTARTPCCFDRHMGPSPNRRDGERGAPVAIDVRLAENPSRFWLIDPLVVALGASAYGHVEPNYGSGAHSTLLNGEIGECWGKDPWVVLTIVGKNPVDAFGRSSDRTVRRHMDLAHSCSLTGVPSAWDQGRAPTPPGTGG